MKYTLLQLVTYSKKTLILVVLNTMLSGIKKFPKLQIYSIYYYFITLSYDQTKHILNIEF